MSCLPEDEKPRWNELVTRSIPMPDGTERPMTMQRVYWGCFDYLVRECDKSPKYLVEITIEELVFQGWPFDRFEDEFKAGLVFMDQEYTRLRSAEWKAELAESLGGPPSLHRIKELEAMKRPVPTPPEFPD